MKTSSEPLTTSPVSGHSSGRPEKFDTPELTSLASLTDGRGVGEYQSAYPISAWIQIIAELLYLLVVLAGSFGALALLAKYVVLNEASGPVFAVIGPPTTAVPLVVYTAVTFAGICGGCASSLKWLYHAVAKKRWHRDRIVWRAIVPPLSGILAVFTAMMIISGIVPFLSRASLAGPASGAGSWFFCRAIFR